MKVPGEGDAGAQPRVKTIFKVVVLEWASCCRGSVAQGQKVPRSPQMQFAIMVGSTK